MRGVRRARACGAVTAVVGVLLAACGGGAPTVTPSSGAPSSEATESASPTESVTPTETESEVLPANDVEDPLEALQAIWDYYRVILEEPDPDKLELIFHPECDCYSALHALLEDWRAEGSHVEPDGGWSFEIVESLLITQTTANYEYRLSVPAIRLVSEDGSVLEQAEASEKQYSVVLLQEGGRWRVRSQS